MKNFIFGLIATVMISFAGNAQTERNSALGGQMVTIVHAMKPSYTAGMKLPDWIKTTGPYNPTPTDIEFLTKTFNYLERGTPDCEILKADNSIIQRVATAPVSDSPAAAGRFCWRCLWEIIKDVVDLILDSVKE
jgi:hypothetical protein